MAAILLVEDDPGDAELTITALRACELDERDITLVADGVEAIEHLRGADQAGEHHSSLPAVVLLDLKMPRMDGRAVLREMRSDEHLRHVPVVVLSSSRQDDDVCEAYALGANAYVVKPVAFNEYLETVGHIAAFWTNINESPPLQ